MKVGQFTIAQIRAAVTALRSSDAPITYKEFLLEAGLIEGKWKRKYITLSGDLLDTLVILDVIFSGQKTLPIERVITKATGKPGKGYDTWPERLNINRSNKGAA